MAKTEAATRQQIELKIREKKFYPIYLLMGEEPFYIDKISDAILANALTEEERDFNLTIFYGNETTMTDVILACRRYPVMSERQVIILREAQALKNKNDIELLQYYAEKPQTSTILVICFKGGTLKSAALTKALGKKLENGETTGVIFDSKRIPEYNIGSAISEYIRSIGCTIEEKAQALLIEYVGNDMSRLAKEIDKLKLISPNGIRITTDMVEKNIGVSKEFNNFELIKAIASRNKVKAFTIVQYFTENPSKGPTPLISILLFNFFSNLLIAYYTRTTDERVLMTALRLKSPYALKDYRLGMPNYNASKCLYIITAIREFDAQSKGIRSNKNEYVLLKELMTKIFNA